jgi:hypothetical protein
VSTGGHGLDRTLSSANICHHATLGYNAGPRERQLEEEGAPHISNEISKCAVEAVEVLKDNEGLRHLVNMVSDSVQQLCIALLPACSDVRVRADQKERGAWPARWIAAHG